MALVLAVAGCTAADGQGTSTALRPPGSLDALEDAMPRMSAAERSAVGARLKACYGKDAAGAEQGAVRLVAAFDGEGRVRQVASADAADADTPSPGRRAWIDRAAAAVVSPACNPLPLPPGVLGRPGRINLRFIP